MVGPNISALGRRLYEFYLELLQVRIPTRIHVPRAGLITPVGLLYLNSVP